MIFTDCVVPISKLNLGTKFQESCDFASSLLGSHLLDPEVTVQPLLCDHHSMSQSAGESSNIVYSDSSNTTGQTSSSLCNYHPLSIGDTSLTPTALESPSYASRIDTNTVVDTIPHILDDKCTFRSTISPRQAASTEHLNELSHLAMHETQRVRRNSSGSEFRVRRHSAAPFRLDSHMQRHRRRSHDVRDEQADLLKRLHVAATRRRSLSLPFQSAARNLHRPNNL